MIRSKRQVKDLQLHLESLGLFCEHHCADCVWRSFKDSDDPENENYCWEHEIDVRPEWSCLEWEDKEDT